MTEFKAWPKTPRLFRDIVITEKIDGTNAAVIVSEPYPFGYHMDGVPLGSQLGFGPLNEGGTPDEEFIVTAQSRKRLITPGKQTDNYGFAWWVFDNADALAQLLGPGYHYGEWWGKGIQHGYGLDEKRFSLFNTHRYKDAVVESNGLLHLVPELYVGPYSEREVRRQVEWLDQFGSVAAPGAKAEGIIMFHTASSQVYKVLCEHDELPKGKVPYSEKVLAEAQGKSDWRETGAYL